MPRPGSRNHKANLPRHMQGRYADSREAWVHFGKYEIVEFVSYSEEDEDEPLDTIDPDIPVVRVSFRFPGRKPIIFNLTALTAPELEAWAEIINHAIERARPATVRLDEVVKEKAERGDNAYARLYRQVPVVTYRTREVRQHHTSLPKRPDGDTPLANPEPESASGEQSTGTGLLPTPEPSPESGSAEEPKTTAE